MRRPKHNMNIRRSHNAKLLQVISCLYDWYSTSGLTNWTMGTDEIGAFHTSLRPEATKSSTPVSPVTEPTLVVHKKQLNRVQVTGKTKSGADGVI